jgi:uncharacterized protein YcbX
VPFLDRILLYPIKSLDGVAVSEARVLQGGSLAHDREFAMVDERGDFVNGKRDQRVHLIRASFDGDFRTVTLRVQGKEGSQTFGLGGDAGLEGWLSAFFGFRVRVAQDGVNGFPDDPSASGPTVVSGETLREVGAWFGGLNVEETQARFRPNLILGDAPAFWEDRLFGEPGASVGFEIGAVRFEGVNPCARCEVPTRDPRTGEMIRGFQKRFTERRAGTLPAWAAASRFDHFYRLSVNTRIPPSEAGKALKVGDEVRVIG